ncbi:MAG: hypothetical protein COA42_04740 [Alteromonadaceae bacterium]|nr:MAG: hypothetical protein COA42_04740 [Alteromonadaceae bacterium]
MAATLSKATHAIPPTFGSLLAKCLCVFLIACLYYLAARLSLQLQFANTQASPVWPPSGIALAALMLWGYSMGYGVFLGAFCANFIEFLLKSEQSIGTFGELLQYLQQTPGVISVSFWIALGNTCEAIFAVYLFDRLKMTRTPFYTLAQMIHFFIICILVSILAASSGVLALVLGGFLPLNLASQAWFTWWLGDATGIFVLTPLLVHLLKPHWFESLKNIKKILSIPALLHYILIVSLSLLTFGDYINNEFFNSQAFLLLPVLIVTVMSQGLLQANIGILLVSAIAIQGTLMNVGPFSGREQNESLVLLQSFIGVICMTIYLLGAMLRERGEALTALNQYKEHLEQRVSERTEELSTLNNELSNVNENLRHSNQALDDFAHIASHDLKEPLRGIENHLTFLKEDFANELPKGAYDRVQKIPPIIKHLETLIDSLLRYSQVGCIGFNKSHADLNAIVKSVVDSLDGCFEMDEIELRQSQELPIVIGDPVLIGELFRNLITNAIKYNDKASKWIEIGYDSNKKNIGEFYVKDNGIGIREQHLKKVFNLFKRLNGREQYGGGTGVGMSIVKKIISQHGGEIWIESVFGQGTTVYFTLEARYEC